MQSEILEMIVRSDTAEGALGELCARVEQLVPGAIAGITVLDRAAHTFERAIFPSLKATFANGVRGMRVADRPGSCALAIHDNRIVTCDDIAADSRFSPEWRTLNLDHGVRSIQSRPVLATDGAPLGTFVLAFQEPRAATAFDEEVAALGAHLAGLALTHYRRAQQHELLIGELQHRMRNLFSSIGALVYLTLQANPEPKQFQRVFEGRLSALARAHSLVLQRSGADLASLIAEILAPYGGAPRVEVNGPPIKLAPEAAVAFSLATHELATNASKYGALSSREGKLQVTWGVQQDAGGKNIFHLQWAERGGPTLAAPTGKSGFGRSAIEQSLAQAVDGVVKLEFPPQGLICTIEAPLTERLGLYPTSVRQ